MNSSNVLIIIFGIIFCIILSNIFYQIYKYGLIGYFNKRIERRQKLADRLIRLFY